MSQPPYGNDPYNPQNPQNDDQPTAPYGQPAGSQQNNPYGQPASQGDPYGQAPQGDPYGQQPSPYGDQAAQAPQSDPYGGGNYGGDQQYAATAPSGGQQYGNQQYGDQFAPAAGQYGAVPPIAGVDPYGQQPGGGERKSFIATWLFALLLGTVGGDRFYLGKIGTAILKLITGGGFYIWYWIDLFNTLRGKRTDKNGQPVVFEGYEENKKMAWIVSIILVALQVIGLVIGIISIIFSIVSLLATGAVVSSTVPDDTDTPAAVSSQEAGEPADDSAAAEAPADDASEEAPADDAAGATDNGVVSIAASDVQSGLDKLGSGYSETTPTEGQFVTMTLKASDVSGSGTDFNYVYLKLIDDQGNSYEASMDGFLGLDDALIYEEIPADASVDGEVAFDIPADAKPDHLSYAPFDADEITVPLS